MLPKKHIVFLLSILLLISLSFSDGSWVRVIKETTPLYEYEIRSDLQRSVIMYDAINKQERMILQIILNSESDEVGWVIALPSMPEIYEWGKDALFEVLNKTLVKFEYKSKPGCGCLMVMAADGGTGDEIGDLTIYPSVTVGALNLTPIEATNADALISWLQDRNVTFDYIESSMINDFKEIINDYLNDEENDWVFIYGRFNVEPEEYGGTQLLTFEYETKQPFYPMKITKFQQQVFKQSYLETRIWLISDNEYHMGTREDVKKKSSPGYVSFFNHYRLKEIYYEISPELFYEVLDVLNIPEEAADYLWVDYYEGGYSDLEEYKDIWFIELD